ncbi:MAG: glutamate synthase subunit beta [Deltaproteobacteria bacterium]|jgi:glutamate synthase (NADPH/NADH) small chain|nr:glutamate synthase subunit beta [Deltaproteobacteria bacterium]
MSTYRPIAERIKDFRPVELPLVGEPLRSELRRCQDCGIPFCHAMGCPLGNVIPEINTEALHGRHGPALMKLLATSPFPEFTARICPALCEGSCVQGLNDVPVPIRLAELEVIERGFADGLVKALPPKTRLGISVGIVGSGPAGLSAAFYLNRAGAKVTVYEKDQAPGGFLRYGIPDFKLEKSVIDRRVLLMESEGVGFRTGVLAGEDISLRLLKREHDALILAIGSRRKRDLPIPGRDLRGVHFATDYLTAQNMEVSGELESIPEGLSAFGKKVIVIGGGDTGSDCVGTAWRQGAREVCQYEIMPEPPKSRADSNPWPQWPKVFRTSSSLEEGGHRRWNVDSLAFLPSANDPSALGALKFREVEWAKDDKGAFKPIPKPGTETVEQCDMVFLAMGFTGAEPGTLAPAEGFKSFRPGGLVAPGVYACGDAATGPSLVVRAMADGLAVARTALLDLTAGGFDRRPHEASIAFGPGRRA